MSKTAQIKTDSRGRQNERIRNAGVPRLIHEGLKPWLAIRLKNMIMGRICSCKMRLEVDPYAFSPF